MLQERLEAKERRDYATADRIRTELESRGVKINDARTPGMMGMWTASDGRRGNTSGPNFFMDPVSGSTTATQPSETPAGATISNEDLIAKLAQRLEAK